MENNIKTIKQSIYSILSKFSKGTIRGIKFSFIQIFIWIAIERICNLLGYRFYWGRFGILALALLCCIFAYTMLYSWFYSFTTVRLRNIFIPYLIYASLIYLGIAQEYDWNFKIVTIDEYMLMGWLIPLYGLSIFILKEIIKKWLCHYPNALNITRKVFNILILLFICLHIIFAKII